MTRCTSSVSGSSLMLGVKKSIPMTLSEYEGFEMLKRSIVISVMSLMSFVVFGSASHAVSEPSLKLAKSGQLHGLSAKPRTPDREPIRPPIIPPIRSK